MKGVLSFLILKKRTQKRFLRIKDSFRREKQGYDTAVSTYVQKLTFIRYDCSENNHCYKKPYEKQANAGYFY